MLETLPWLKKRRLSFSVFLLCLKPALGRARRLTNDWSYLAPYGNPTMPIPTWQRVLCFFLLVNDCTMHTSAWQGKCSFWRSIISYFFWFVLGEWVYPRCQRRLPAISKLDISVPNIQSPLLFNFPVQRHQECCRTATPISYLPTFTEIYCMNKRWLKEERVAGE